RLRAATHTLIKQLYMVVKPGQSLVALIFCQYNNLIWYAFTFSPQSLRLSSLRSQPFCQPKKQLCSRISIRLPEHPSLLNDIGIFELGMLLSAPKVEAILTTSTVVSSSCQDDATSLSGG